MKFRVTANSGHGASAIRSLDEIRIAEAYLSGDLDIEGDLLAAFDLRNSLTDRHFVAYLWSTYGQRLVRGQTVSDKKWVHQHYDTDGNLHLQFLDKQFRCYSHRYFENDQESLEAAIQRKLATAFNSVAADSSNERAPRSQWRHSRLSTWRVYGRRAHNRCAPQ